MDGRHGCPFLDEVHSDMDEHAAYEQAETENLKGALHVGNTTPQRMNRSKSMAPHVNEVKLTIATSPKLTVSKLYREKSSPSREHTTREDDLPQINRMAPPGQLTMPIEPRLLTAQRSHRPVARQATGVSSDSSTQRKNRRATTVYAPMLQTEKRAQESLQRPQEVNLTKPGKERSQTIHKCVAHPTKPQQESSIKLSTQNTLTIPMGPKLQTLRRSERTYETQATETNQLTRVDGSKRRRARNIRELTVPESPHLSTMLRGPKLDTLNPNLAEQPTTTKKQGTFGKVPTKPETPKLHSTHRSRATFHKSYEESELESIERARAKFHDLRRQTLSSFQRIIDPSFAQHVPHPRVYNSKAATETASPMLLTRKRMGLRQDASAQDRFYADEAERSLFRARPLDPKILRSHGELGLPQKKDDMPLTDAKTPHLLTRARSRIEPVQQVNNEQRTEFLPSHSLFLSYPL